MGVPTLTPSMSTAPPTCCWQAPLLETQREGQLTKGRLISKSAGMLLASPTPTCSAAGVQMGLTLVLPCTLY